MVRYEMSNCLFEATLQHVEEVCNCTPKYFVDIIDGYEACEGKQKKCMNRLLAEIGDRRSIIDGGLEKVKTSVTCIINILRSQLTLLVSSVSDAPNCILYIFSSLS